MENMKVWVVISDYYGGPNFFVFSTKHKAIHYAIEILKSDIEYMEDSAWKLNIEIALEQRDVYRANELWIQYQMEECMDYIDSVTIQSEVVDAFASD